MTSSSQNDATTIVPNTQNYYYYYFAHEIREKWRKYHKPKRMILFCVFVVIIWIPSLRYVQQPKGNEDETEWMQRKLKLNCRWNVAASSNDWPAQPATGSTESGIATVAICYCFLFYNKIQLLYDVYNYWGNYFKLNKKKTDESA